MKETQQNRTHRILSLIVIVAGIYGSVRTIWVGGRPDFNHLLYFTVMSNLAIAGLYLYFLYAERRELRDPSFRIPQGMHTLKYVLTISISLTCGVFFVLLLPQYGLSVLWMPGNLSTHLIAPIAAILDYIFFEKSQVKQRFTLLYTVIPPYAYVVLTLVLSRLGVRYAEGEIVPYFFLNYEKLGWLRFSENGIGVIYWILIISVVMLGIGQLILALNTWAQKRKN
ncbi:MAG: Pr6Pr family membrane protein [Candidatus Cloacimonetes bacterium]|nr:Pr6Pr family membrane protein [Candidatus Cloacimonadota bacterium]MDY0230522.1 Pr6Pr family membrane protein [Candidatus Cloacimonadaceae bacterium]